MWLNRPLLLANYISFLNGIGVNPVILTGIPNNLQDVQAGFTSYQNCLGLLGGNLLLTAPLEVHPYLFKHPVHIKRRKLIIGTFPPITNIGDYLISVQLPLGNVGQPKVSFFNGNEMSIWKFCGDPVLKASLMNFSNLIITRDQMVGEILNYLTRHSLSISDIILCCQREIINGLYTAKDLYLNNIILNKSLINVLVNDNEIKELVFANSGANGVYGIKMRTNLGNLLDPPGSIMISNRDALSLFLRGCQILSVRVDLKIPPSLVNPAGVPWFTMNILNEALINNCFSNKMLFYLRLYRNESSYKEYVINTPPSPSGDARRGLSNNAIYLSWSAAAGGSVDQYRTFIYDAILNGNNHALLINLNQ